MLIEAQTEGRARAVETVPADFSGGEPVIAFNPHYLLDGLVAAAVPGQPRPHAGSPDSTGHEDAGQDGARTAGTDEGNTAPGDPGLPDRVHRPGQAALITRVTAEHGPEGARVTGETAGESGGAEFRYLVVPLRAPQVLSAEPAQRLGAEPAQIRSGELAPVPAA